MVVDTEVQQKTKRRCGRFLILGIPNALLSFALASTGVIITDLIVYRTCLASLNINQTDCLMLRTNSGSPEAAHLEAEVEPYASLIVMTKSVIEGILPAILSLFIGTWSDRGGRRPVLIAGFTSFIVMFATLSLMCNWNISPWYLLISSIPAYIMGGSCTIALAFNCYISDTTEKQDRTVLLAWLQVSTFCGVVLGLMAGPAVYQNYGYTSVFSVATVCCTCGLVHTYFFISESVKEVSKEPLQRLFKISRLKEIVTSCVTKRDGFHRPIVWLGIFIYTLNAMVWMADMNLGYLFARARLGWDVVQASHLASAGVVLCISGLCAVSLLSPALGISDTALCAIGFISAMSGFLVKSFAWQSWHMYLAVAVGVFGGVAGPVMRSIVSKSVPAQDVGKVFSLMGLLETISPMGGAPLFTLVYSHYLPPIYPSPVYILASSCLLLLLLLLVCIEVLLRRSRNLPYIPTAQEDIKL